MRVYHSHVSGAFSFARNLQATAVEAARSGAIRTLNKTLSLSWERRIAMNDFRNRRKKGRNHGKR